MALGFESGQKDEGGKKFSATSQMSAIHDDSSVVQKVDAIIEDALEEEATDILFEPHAEEVIIRAKIHGSFQKMASFPINLLNKIINRIKILSAMDITKNKQPQKGFFKVITDEMKIEILAFTFPSIRGETASLNIQYKQGLTLTLDDLGMLPSMLSQFKKIVNRPSGLIIATGPPGNGKSTTLYATLQHLFSEEKHLATFEEVVKYELPEVIQGKPDEKSEFTYEDGVRGIILTRPDVLLVGAIPNGEVASMIVQSACEKRTILGRMSANDTVNALQNLVDMGLSPFLIGSAVNGVISQRLVRKICEHCKESYSPSEKLVKDLGLKVGISFYRGKGCLHCNKTGNSGIVAIFEVLPMREEITELIVSKASSRKIREKAVQLGMVTLKKDGIYKATKGITSIEEVLNSI